MRHSGPRLLLALGFAFIMAGCSGSSEESSDATLQAVATTSEASVDASTGDDSLPDDSDDEAAGPELPPPFPELVVQPTEPGPRPLLAWDTVEGAVDYELFVLDADGAAYWAWSGTETSVYLGGMENPDAVGAWVFEPLTWVVAAVDADGTTLAMSTRADLLP